jgi:phage-related protein
MTRRISWVGSSFKDLQKFPEAVQAQITFALQIAAKGEAAETSKPMKGLGAGVFEIAIRYRADAYRAVYAVRLGSDIYVLHAFQKKSKTGIKTPQREVDLIKDRLKRLKERLR